MKNLETGSISLREQNKERPQRESLNPLGSFMLDHSGKSFP
jgi:hypothetical protein